MMSIDISQNLQSRLMASAQAEGVSLDVFLERLINERDELTAIIEQTEARCESLSQEDIEVRLNGDSYNPSAVKLWMATLSLANC